VLGLNTVYGVAAYLYVHKARYDADGKACANVQVYRASQLTIEVCVFWITFIIFSFPQIWFKILGKANLEDAIKENDDDEDESEEVTEKK
jgi:hypothetical protein